MIGTILAHYRITDALGAGGMGEVWRAIDEKLGREVALKVLPDEFAKDPDRMARFEREAKVLASLNHPNIATLYGLESAPVIPSEAPGRVEGSPEARSKNRSHHAPEKSGDPSTRRQGRLAQDDRCAYFSSAPSTTRFSGFSSKLPPSARCRLTRVMSCWLRMLTRAIREPATRACICRVESRLILPTSYWVLARFQGHAGPFSRHQRGRFRFRD